MANRYRTSTPHTLAKYYLDKEINETDPILRQIYWRRSRMAAALNICVTDYQEGLEYLKWAIHQPIVDQFCRPLTQAEITAYLHRCA